MHGIQFERKAFHPGAFCRVFSSLVRDQNSLFSSNTFTVVFFPCAEHVFLNHLTNFATHQPLKKSFSPGGKSIEKASR